MEYNEEEKNSLLVATLQKSTIVFAKMSEVVSSRQIFLGFIL